MFKHLVDVFDDALAVDLHRLIGDVPQGNMVDRSVLGEIDLLACKHVISKFLQLSFLGELGEELDGAFFNEVFGEIEEYLRLVCRVVESPTEFLESARVLFEGFPKDDLASEGDMVLLEFLPGIQIARLGESRHAAGRCRRRRMRLRMRSGYEYCRQAQMMALQMKNIKYSRYHVDFLQSSDKRDPTQMEGSAPVRKRQAVDK